MAAGDAEQLVVDVGDDPHLVAFAEAVHGRVGLPEGEPPADAVRQELCPRRLDLPADLLRRPYRGAAQHLGVELIGAADDVRLDLEEPLHQRRLVEAEAVPLGLGVERVENPLLPVDQGSVAVGGDPGDVLELRQRHE